MPVAPSTASLYTTILNTSGVTKTFSFLPPHGKTLTAGQSVTFVGSVYQYLKNARKLAGFLSAVTRGDICLLSGPTRAETVLCAVGNTSVIAPGDLLYLTSGAVKSAADFTWDTNLATTQAGFKALFIGVALAAHANGGGAITTFPVDISQEAIYNYACTSETHEIGDTLAPAKAAGNALLPQKLVKAVAGSSIARCESRDASAATTVSVRLQSAFRGQNVSGAQ